jgi:hypothetical protein
MAEYVPTQWRKGIQSRWAHTADEAVWLEFNGWTRDLSPSTLPPAVQEWLDRRHRIATDGDLEIDSSDVLNPGTVPGKALREEFDERYGGGGEPGGDGATLLQGSGITIIPEEDGQRIGLDWPDLDAAYSRRGDLVVDVRDHGAAGDGATVDTAAIRAAIAAATHPAWEGTARTRVVFPASAGYLVDDTITVPPGVDVSMDAPIVYAGPAGRPALVHGATGATTVRRSQSRYRVRRAAQSDWSSEADIGLRLVNLYWSHIEVTEAVGFTVGVQATGDGFGFAYNTVHLGQLQDNKIALDVTNANAGWCNENVWIGGGFTVQSALHTSLDRIGIRFNSAATYYNNANLFIKPSFEIKGELLAAEGICVLARYGSHNTIRDARHESPDTVALRQENASMQNEVTFQSNQYANRPRVDDAGEYSGGLVVPASTKAQDAAKRLIYKIDGMHRSACYYDGATRVNIPGAAALSSSATRSVLRAGAANTVLINPDYLEVTQGSALGFYMSTRRMKRFTLALDCEAGYGGRYIIGAYDAAGNAISTAGTVRTQAGTLAWSTSYGGVWRMQQDSEESRHFSVTDAVDHVFVAVTGGTLPARLRALAAYALDNVFIPSAWTPWNDGGVNYGTTPPTAGTWERGRRLINDTFNIAAGAPSEWVCTVAGTPGTWKTFGSIGA